jgi:hypothetical protein
MCRSSVDVKRRLFIATQAGGGRISRSGTGCTCARCSSPCRRLYSPRERPASLDLHVADSERHDGHGYFYFCRCGGGVYPVRRGAGHCERRQGDQRAACGDVVRNVTGDVWRHKRRREPDRVREARQRCFRLRRGRRAVVGIMKDSTLRCYTSPSMQRAIPVGWPSWYKFL